MWSFLNYPPTPSTRFRVKTLKDPCLGVTKCHLVVPFMNDHLEERFTTSSLQFATSRQMLHMPQFPCTRTAYVKTGRVYKKWKRPSSIRCANASHLELLSHVVHYVEYCGGGRPVRSPFFFFILGQMTIQYLFLIMRRQTITMLKRPVRSFQFSPCSTYLCRFIFPSSLLQLIVFTDFIPGWFFCSIHLPIIHVH